MNRPETERAAGLLARADADLAAVRALEANKAVGDEIVGFHAQQAAEKVLKAVLATHAIEYPRTHSIRFLIDLLADHELGLPEPLRSVEELYPYAVQLRYDAPVGEDPLDRPSVRKLLERLRAWATDQISRV